MKKCFLLPFFLALSIFAEAQTDSVFVTASGVKIYNPVTEETFTYSADLLYFSYYSAIDEWQCYTITGNKVVALTDNSRFIVSNATTPEEKQNYLFTYFK